MDDVLSLGVSKCKYLLFIGSVGSLVEEINIGDLVIPIYSICGDVASRYLNENLEDDFGKRQESNKNLTQLLIKHIQNISNEENVKYHNAVNFSVDTVFGQFPHIDTIKDMGA